MNVSLLISVEMSQPSRTAAAKSPPDYALKILHSRLSAKAEKHVSMEYENWLQYAESQIKANKDDVICHISQYHNNHDSLLFVIVDSSAIIPATSVASAAGRRDLLEDWWKPINESAFITTIINARESKTDDINIIASSSLKNKIWIMQLTAERSLRMAADEFVKSMSVVGTLGYSCFESNVNDLIVSQSASSKQEAVDVERDMLLSNVGLNAVSGTLFRVINTTKGLSEGVIRSTTSIAKSDKTLKSLKDDFDNWKGPMAESTIRHIVSKREGKRWAESRRFKSLDDVLLWIGSGIGATQRNIDRARKKIVSALIYDFDGFTADGTGVVRRSHLKGTK
jgi:hypothetical protein